MKVTINFRTASTNFINPITFTKFQKKKGVKRPRKDWANNANVVLNDTDFEYKEEVHSGYQRLTAGWCYSKECQSHDN